jgi:molecular chaperone DnaK
MKAVGIDLGTDTATVAWVDETGRSFLLRNREEGECLTPSAVYFDDGNVIIGAAAHQAASADAGRLAVAVKRELGMPVYSKPICGQRLPPEVIQACILRWLKSDIFTLLGPAARVVLAVPATCDERRRKAAVDAGAMAGLPLIGTIDEGTAAAIAFGEVLGLLNEECLFRVPQTVFVYDLGGGSFSAAMLRMTPLGHRLLAMEDEACLGGQDWDDRMVDLVARQWMTAHGRDPRQEAGAAASLRVQCVEAKHRLSSAEKTTVRVQYEGWMAESILDRAQFEAATSDLLERTIAICENVRNRVGLSWQGVDHVLLAGAATHMPAVARRLQALTGRRPDQTAIPEELIARGAAIFAHHLLLRKADGDSTSPAGDPSHATGARNLPNQGPQATVPESVIEVRTPFDVEGGSNGETAADNEIVPDRRDFAEPAANDARPALPPSPPVSPQASHVDRNRPSLPTPLGRPFHWAARLIVYAGSAGMGIAIAYLVLRWLLSKTWGNP